MDKWPEHITPSFTRWLPEGTEIRLSEVDPAWIEHFECSTTYYFSEQLFDKALYLGRYGEKFYLV